MKKILKKTPVMSTRDDFPMTGSHIHFLRILAFANEGINFTEKETGHFDVCRGCRLKVVESLRKLAPQVVRTITPRAA